MKLTFQNSYKSIQDFSPTDLPDFTVITGLNGSGKTHLLEAIGEGAIKIKIDGINVNNNQIRLFNWLNLVPNDTNQVDISSEKNNHWKQLSNVINQYKPSLDKQINQLNLPSDISTEINTNLANFCKMTKERFLEKFGDSQHNENYYTQINNIIEKNNCNLVNSFQQKNRNSALIDCFAKKIDIPLIAFDENIFFKNYTPIPVYVNAFQQSFGRLFLSYQEQLNIYTLEQRELAKTDESITKEDLLSDEKFYQKQGKPPWNFVNEVLEQNKLEFRINYPEQYNAPYEPKLIHQPTKKEIKFQDLSSGERILMSFVLCLYYTSDKRQTVNYPKVLLFDEIDAPLHPSMTLSVLNTIQQILVEEQGIKVIMTTHSPSTVALSPENSIYVMDKETRSLKKTTKDKALAILTSGVPTLSINHENRRQVFVESEYDVKCYEKIYSKLKDKLTPEISLNFMSIGTEGENCKQVKYIVNKLVDYGNKNIYGIIDWDKNNKSNKSHPNIKVLGEDKRYTIENYIFDPVLVGVFLLREKHINFDQLGLKENRSYLDIRNFTNSDFQSIVDCIIKRLSPNLTDESSDTNLIECKYLNDYQLKIPKWFLQKKGHDLSALFTKTFPKLNKYRENNGNSEEILKEKILNTVFDDYPELISVDFLDLFKDIQNDNN